MELADLQVLIIVTDMAISHPEFLSEFGKLLSVRGSWSDLNIVILLHGQLLHRLDSNRVQRLIVIVHEVL